MGEEQGSIQIPICQTKVTFICGRRTLLGLCGIGRSRGFSLGITQSGIPLVTFKEQISSPHPFEIRALAFSRGDYMEV